MIEGIRCLIIDGLGPRGAGARLRQRRGLAAGRARWRPRRRCARGWCGHERAASARWRCAVAWRSAAQLLHQPGVHAARAAVPAVLLHRVRGRPVGGRLRARASTTAAATRRSSTCSCCCRRRRSAACSRASRSRATSSPASRAGCCSPRPSRGGIVAGYCARRAAARGRSRSRRDHGRRRCSPGMDVSGSGVDLVGLYMLALLVNAAAMLFGSGVAMRLRTMQAGPADPDAGLPDPVPRAGLGAARPADRLGRGGRQVNPVTLVLEAGRGLIAGRPEEVAAGLRACAAAGAVDRCVGARRAAQRRARCLTQRARLGSRHERTRCTRWWRERATRSRTSTRSATVRASARCAARSA